MIADTDEFISIDLFSSVGIVTTDTFNTWRKKDNGLVHTLSSYIENSSAQAISVTNSTISLKTSGVSTVHLADGVITSIKIATGAITDVKIGANAVTTAKLNDLSVTTTKLNDSSVTTAKLNDSSVTTAKLNDSSVTTAKLADVSVTTAKLADVSVITAKLNDSSVTTAKLADSNVTTNKLANLGVTTAKLADSNVTTNKLANLGVTTAKLADLSITASKIGGNNIPKQMIWNSYASTSSVSGSWSSIFSATIIVANDSSKVRVNAVLHGSTQNAGVPMGLRIVCNGNLIANSMGTSNSNRINSGSQISTSGGNDIACAVMDFIQDRNAGEYTYEVQARVASGVNGNFNRSRNDADNSDSYRTISSITLTELS